MTENKTVDLSSLPETVIERLFDLFEKFVEAGESDLFEGYAASILATDFLHSAGLTSQRAYDAIFVMETIMGAADIVAIFGGGSAFAPSLKSKTIINLAKELKEKGIKTKDVQAALSLAKSGVKTE